MRQAIWATFVVVWVVSASAGEIVLDGVAFSLPDGFTVERAAAPPLVERPITCDFDELGRLYVTDSSGSNAPVVEQRASPTHRIRRLEDLDGDGIFDRGTVFAEGLMLPEGTLWHRGALYVAAPPEIWKFVDEDDNGVADRREVWFDGRTLTGCANDLHGPYLGPDGLLYWCKGAFAEQTHDLPGRPGWSTRASHVFRSREDGGGFEMVLTGGMDNPVDLAFARDGESFLSSTFLVHPAGGQRDGIVHALPGGVYGKDHGVLDGHPRTGDLLPVLVHLGPAAACGLAVHDGFGFGGDYAGNLFCCGFNLRTVSRHVLTPRGSTYVSTDTPFLVADAADFHPTDVVEDADGSLLVVDTGGWYKLCCPTSQVEKPAALGGLYRIRHTAAVRSTDPRGRAIAWGSVTDETLVALLGDERPAVVSRAIDEAARRGAQSVPLLRRSLADPVAGRRLAAVWALCRIDGDPARAAIRIALGDADAAVCRAAVHAAGLHRDTAALVPLVGLAAGRDAGLARSAAAALGRLGGPAAVRGLLAAAGGTGAAARGDADRELDHAIIAALTDCGLVEPLLEAVHGASPRVRRLALVALDQLPLRHGGGPVLDADTAVGLLDADDAALRDAAWWVAVGHPERADTLAPRIEPQLEHLATLPPEAAERSRSLVARVAAQPAVADALGAIVATGADPAAHGAVVEALSVMRRATPAAVPDAWVDAVAARAVSADPVAVAALETLGSLSLSVPQRQAIRDRLVGLAEADPSRSLAALRILGPATGALPGPLVASLLALLDASDSSLLDRQAAATVLAAATLPADAAAALEAAQQRLARPAGVEPADREAFERIAAALPAGDVARGHAVYTSRKAACASCHAMAYVGGRVGPDLSRIGGIRSPRDLLEAILLPSATFVRSYEPVTLLTVDGRSFQGVVREETATELVLQTNATAVERIPRDAIESLLPGAVSLMPKGYDTLFTPQELADLVAFLSNAK